MAAAHPLARAARELGRCAHGLRRGLGGALAGALLVLGAVAQDQAPPIEDLAQYQAELADLLADVDDADFERFARELILEEDGRSRVLEGVDWDVVFSGLRAAAGRRGTLDDLAAGLAYRHGVSLNARGRWAAADAALVEALDGMAQDDPLRGWVLSSRAQAAISEERWDEGFELLDSAERAAAEGREGDDLRAWVRRRRAEAWVLIGMPELALDELRASWETARSGDDRRAQRNAFELLANALLSADDFDALRRLEVELGPELEGEAWSPADRAIFEYRFATGDVDAGLRSPARSRSGRERLETLLESDMLDGPRRRWSLEWLARGCLDAGDHGGALAAVERLEGEAESSGSTEDPGRVERVALRARAALGLAGQGATEVRDLAQRLDEVREAWGSARVGWADVPTRDGGVGYLLLSRRQGLVEALLGLTLRLEGSQRGAESAFEWLVEAQSLSTLARRLDAPATTFAAARRTLLGERRGLLAWVPLRNRSFLLAADRTRAQLFALAPSHELEGACEGLLDALDARLQQRSAGSDGELNAAAGLASAALLPPEVREFMEGWDEVYLCGLDDLGLVPFELLQDGAGATQGTRRSLARLPSIPVGLVLAERARTAAPAGVCVVVADTPEPEAARRFGVEPWRTGGEEERTLFSGWGDDRLRTLRGAGATLPALTAELGPGVGFVHVLGHGVRRRDER
ncbi:MAG TPA: CHAT domain-containing protein, partial [Planctomycetota bacterium]|nr:CHAT domain-containing protein [Planctomycetota bacterium]